MTSPLVAVERDAGVLRLTIDRPEAFNALNGQVLAELGVAFAAAADDPSLRAVVVTGRGEKAFSAGADLHELDGLDVDDAHALITAGQAVMRAIETCPVPVIAAVDGLALGGGFELVLACTFPVLSTRAQLALPEAGLGLIPGYGGTQRLSRVVGPVVAAHVMLSGERLDAARAHELGLTPLAPVAPEKLRATVDGVVETIAAKGPRAVRSILGALRHGRDTGLELALALETGLAARAIAGAESAEGVAAFRARRSPHFATPPLSLGTDA